MARERDINSSFKPFSFALREMRLAKKVTQQRVADECGISKGYLSQMETGKTPARPSQRVIECLAEKVGSDPVELRKLNDLQAGKLIDTTSALTTIYDIGTRLDRIERRLEEIYSLLQKMAKPSIPSFPRNVIRADQI
ncbi:MAG: helix-turn-helix domain-containing protein [Candidatus Levybacteria bacterium]|nr:helix-turn-helix domain-containing protein [Candidatus Levybacteria bacterium]